MDLREAFRAMDAYGQPQTVPKSAILGVVVKSNPIWREPPQPFRSTDPQDTPEKVRIDDLIESLRELRETPWALSKAWQQMNSQSWKVADSRK